MPDQYLERNVACLYPREVAADPPRLQLPHRILDSHVDHPPDHAGSYPTGLAHFSQRNRAHDLEPPRPSETAQAPVGPPGLLAVVVEEDGIEEPARAHRRRGGRMEEELETHDAHVRVARGRRDPGGHVHVQSGLRRT